MTSRDKGTSRERSTRQPPLRVLSDHLFVEQRREADPREVRQHERCRSSIDLAGLAKVAAQRAPEEPEVEERSAGAALAKEQRRPGRIQRLLRAPERQG